MKQVTAALLFGLLFLFSLCASGQGCSDSGFCTMGAMRPDQIYIKKIVFRINSLELTQHLGHTKYGDWIHSTFMDVNIGVHRKTSIQLRLPAYTVITGNMPTTKGWGDLFVSLNQNIIERDNFQVNLTLVAKFYNRAQDNKQNDSGQSMPMYQQTSLGTDDYILGASVMNRNWMIASAFKHSINPIQNNFDSEAWNNSPLYDIVKVYSPSVGLLPGDDIMLRVERNFRLSQWSFYVGVLNIYRITRDRSLDSNGNTIVLDGTQGLASNFLTGVRYRFNTRSSLKLLVSQKLKERELTPDGLSRDFVSQIAYEFRF